MKVAGLPDAALPGDEGPGLAFKGESLQLCPHDEPARVRAQSVQVGEGGGTKPVVEVQIHRRRMACACPQIKP